MSKTSAEPYRGESLARKQPPFPTHWIVVTDHKKAHVYRKTPAGVERIPEESIACSQPLPGEENQAETFQRDLARWLGRAAREKAFDRLALIAPPETLDALQLLLDESVRGRLCAVLAKDVAEISEDEIEDHIADVVWL